tara:strand:+ start:675 stop:971 length:297 start_codon:yes stop_codon:yes gene_type:complete
MRMIIIILLLSLSTMGQTIPEDKLLHFGTSLVISSTSTAILSYKMEKKKAAWIGFGIGATIGISKEVWDMRWGHSSEKDLFADILGAAVGSLVIRVTF